MLKSFLKIQRPLAVFDPTNSEHRLHYKKFLLDRGWHRCPYQWVIDDHSMDIVHCINKKLVEHYILNDATITKRTTVATTKRKQK